MKSIKYEVGIIKELGENEAIILAAGKEYHILLTDEQTQTIQTLLLEEDIEYFLFDTEEEILIFDDKLNMNELNNEELNNINEGVNDDGTAE
ncbi:hypothetical protein [Halalkalibacter lacteus]|uniref:hypothetical protein n=1 Tax=Halalkalibacter lacteus TaxID=3090663 RepID=UPI002FCA3A07